MWSSARKEMRNHSIAGILATSHSLHSWYKLVKGEPIESSYEIILIGVLNILSCLFVTAGGVFLLPHIPKKTDVIYIKYFVSMIFMCFLTITILMLRLVWVFAARNNQHIAFLRSLGKGIGAIGLSLYCLGVVSNLLPIFEWLQRSRGQAHHGTRVKGQTYNGTKATPLKASHKKRRSLKWFFWDLWFVCPDDVDSGLISSNNIVGLVGAVCQLALLAPAAYVILLISSPSQGSGLEAAIQENNATFLSMATFMDAMTTSATVTVMFDASLVLIGRKSVTECQNEMFIASICLFLSWLPLRNGVIEQFPKFLDMMMDRQGGWQE